MLPSEEIGDSGKHADCVPFNLQRVMSHVSVIRGPCHIGMARPQVADGGTACKMKGSCEYIE